MAVKCSYVVITLNESEIPGAELIHNDIESHTNIQLSRWLQCRGLPHTGTKNKLIEKLVF